MPKFQYRALSPFFLLRRLASYELGDVDRLVAWSEQQRRAREKSLKRLTRSAEDQFVDDMAEIDAFAELYAECAIVALWRCVELFRKRVIANAAGAAKAGAAFQHKRFCRMLEQLGIFESTLDCAEDVNELRCLNNAAKHDGYVGGELATLAPWKQQEGKKIGDLRPHYARLRPLAERYIADLTMRANEWWKKERSGKQGWSRQRET